MSVDKRILAVRGNDARLMRESEEAAQRDGERYLARTALKESWEKVTNAIVQSGIQPDVLVANPEAAARAREINSRRPPAVHISSFLGVERGSMVPREVFEKLDIQIADAIGSSFLPAWDMESYIRFKMSIPNDYFETRLFLGEDATIYTGLDKGSHYYSDKTGPSGVVVPRGHVYPISTYSELDDGTHDAIELALATLVVRRELTIEEIPPESS